MVATIFRVGVINGGFAQIVFAIYALLNLAWDNLDETGALFWKTFIRTISEVLDAVRDLYEIYTKKGTAQAVAGFAIFLMLTSMTMLLMYALSLTTIGVAPTLF